MQNTCVSLIELVEGKIICTDNISLVDTEICTKGWSFVTYGDETISHPRSKKIKIWLKICLPLVLANSGYK